MRIAAAPASGAPDYERVGLAASVSPEAPQVVRTQLNALLTQQRLPQSYVDSVDLYLAEGWTYALSVALPDDQLVHIIGLSQAQAHAYGAAQVPEGGTMLVYALYRLRAI